MKKEIIYWCIGFFIVILLFILVFVISYLSTDAHYIGELNESNIKLAKEVCPGRFVGIDADCGHLSVYCKGFPYPVHSFSHCFDGRIESRYFWEKG